MWHFYMGEGGSLSATSVPKEVYSINQCVGLSARDSVRNPTNLQAFVASEFFCVSFSLPSVNCVCGVEYAC